MPGVAHDAQSRARVIELFEELGRVDLACHGAGVGRRTHYQWMENDPEYKAAFEAAGKRANQLLLDEAHKRAVEGSDRLLEFLIKGRMPETFGDRFKVSGDKDNPLVLQQLTAAETIRRKRQERLNQGKSEE